MSDRSQVIALATLIVAIAQLLVALGYGSTANKLIANMVQAVARIHSKLTHGGNLTTYRHRIIAVRLAGYGLPIGLLLLIALGRRGPVLRLEVVAIAVATAALGAMLAIDIALRSIDFAARSILGLLDRVTGVSELSLRAHRDALERDSELAEMQNSMHDVIVQLVELTERVALLTHSSTGEDTDKETAPHRRSTES